MSEKIYEVNCLNAKTNENNSITIKASGLTRSSGWTNPKLVFVGEVYEEDLYEFKFCATPPSGASQPVLTPISVATKFNPLMPRLRKIRVKSEINSIATTIAVLQEA